MCGFSMKQTGQYDNTNTKFMLSFDQKKLDSRVPEFSTLNSEHNRFMLN